jgi:hypothetical protein
MKSIKRNILKSMLLGALVTASLAAGAGSAQAALGVDFTAPDSTHLVSGTNSIVGWSFTATQDLFVTKLGVYDHDADRNIEGTHSVGLWKSDGTLITSVSVTEPGFAHSKLLTNGKYHMVNASASLQAGQTYVVAATVGISDAFAYFDSVATATAHNLQFNQNLIYGNAVYSDSLIGMPSIDTLSPYGNFGANLDVTPTPVPAAAWLLGSGLLGLVGIRRKQK